MAKWPQVNSHQTQQKEPNATRQYCTTFTIMPCGDRISVDTDGYNVNNTKRRAEEAVKANARRHLRSCNKCSLG